MSQPYLAEIKIFAGNFPPRGWAFCDGTLLPINANQSLYSLLGTTYGGDGRTTFALPDLRGRIAMHAGEGPGLSNHPLGQKSGDYQVTMTTATMPAHNHGIPVSANAGDSDDPDGLHMAATSEAAYVGGNATGQYGSTTTNTGGGTPFNNIQPYLALNYIIALQGLFPSRN